MNDDQRRRAVSANLTAVRDRIRAACAASARDPQEVTIVAITKTFPASDVRILADLGVRHMGENRHPEAGRKARECADLDLTWHFVGQLQRNKANAVAQYADIVESVDRPALIDTLSRAAGNAGREIGVCVQVDLDASPTDSGPSARGGAPRPQVLDLADQIAASAGLRLLGVMAVAPLGQDPGPPFRLLADTHEVVLARHPQARMRSAGMSSDFEAALHAGATHLRLGSALLGRREQVK